MEIFYSLVKYNVVTKVSSKFTKKNVGSFCRVIYLDRNICRTYFSVFGTWMTLKNRHLLICKVEIHSCKWGLKLKSKRETLGLATNCSANYIWRSYWETLHSNNKTFEKVTEKQEICYQDFIHAITIWTSVRIPTSYIRL